MLVRIIKKAMTINLNRFDYIRAIGPYVEAGLGPGSVRIAKCETENAAKALEKAISDAWMFPRSCFVVDSWCSSQGISFE